jgi:hypothetical protein
MPKTTFTFSREEIARIIQCYVAGTARCKAADVRIVINVNGGEPGNDPRDCHVPHLESITAELP